MARGILFQIRIFFMSTRRLTTRHDDNLSNDENENRPKRGQPKLNEQKPEPTNQQYPSNSEQRFSKRKKRKLCHVNTKSKTIKVKSVPIIYVHILFWDPMKRGSKCLKKFGEKINRDQGRKTSEEKIEEENWKRSTEEGKEDQKNIH